MKEYLYSAQGYWYKTATITILLIIDRISYSKNIFKDQL
jgi:hypothetical protein